VKVGDIREYSNGPHVVIAAQKYDNGVETGFSSPIPGPPTKSQQEYRDYQERWDRYKAEQDAAYEAMKQAMAAIITNYTEFATVATTVDAICELYSNYVDKWETE
jgi:hypothetical protein